MLKKRRIAALLLSVIALSNVSSVYGASQQFKIDPSYINNKTFNTSKYKNNSIQTVPIPIQQKLPSLPYDILKNQIIDKVYFNPTLEFENAKTLNKNTIAVEIVVDDETNSELNEERFHKEIAFLFKEKANLVKVEKRRYFMDITQEQLDIIKSIKEVKFITLQPEGTEIPSIAEGLQD